MTTQKEYQKMVLNINYRLMKVKSIAECSHSPLGAFCNLSTCIKLSSALKTFVLSIFDWVLKTGFTVLYTSCLWPAANKYPDTRGIGLMQLGEFYTPCVSPSIHVWLLYLSLFFTNFRKKFLFLKRKENTGKGSIKPQRHGKSIKTSMLNLSIPMILVCYHRRSSVLMRIHSRR